MKKVEYIRCPRCELNFIDKKDKFCTICKMEMQAKGSNIDPEAEMGVCPICKTNYIADDEDMCAMCLKEKELADNLAGLVDPDEHWKTYIENDDVETPDEEFGDMTSVADIDELEDDIIEVDDLGLEDEDILEEPIDAFEEDLDDLGDFDDAFDEDYDEFEDDDEDFDDEY